MYPPHVLLLTHAMDINIVVRATNVRVIRPKKNIIQARGQIEIVNITGHFATQLLMITATFILLTLDKSKNNEQI